MRHRSFGLLLGFSSLGILGVAQAEFGIENVRIVPTAARAQSHSRGAQSFRRIATLPNYLANANRAQTTVSEIVESSRDGRTLVYTDSPGRAIGFIDLANPAAPLSTGKLVLPGEPTSAALLGNDVALVAVNTSPSLAAPNGELTLVSLATHQIVGNIPLGGQPDSLALSPDGRFAAVIIENERDEEVTIDGIEGGLPQLPAGFLAIVDINPSNLAASTVRRVELTGLSTYAPTDPEPEFVAINEQNEAVVTLQENNHVAIVDLKSGKVTRDFPAGAVTLDGVDGAEDGVIALDSTLTDVPREPDAVTWIPGRRGHDYIATANEGDLFGGSRGFSIFDRRGKVVFDSGTSLEEIAVRHGHYPESRSDAKGSEPETVEYGRFGDTDYLFVGSERGSFVTVYRLRHGYLPEFTQLLPAPLGPEGVHAIPSRGLLVVSGEEDTPPFGVRSSVMVYELSDKPATYPMVVSADDEHGQPIAWSALSGLVSLPWSDSKLLAVWDGYYAESRILTLDVSETPAVITEATTIEGSLAALDPEGIAIAPDGTLWIASEGDAGPLRNRLLQTDREGTVLAEIELPAAIEACRAASTTRGTLASGFEGVAVKKLRHGYQLLIAQQRGWNYTTPECEALDDDAAGTNPTEPTTTRLWTYEPDTAAWGHLAYELEPLPPNTSWVGLSEITAVPGGYVVIERDNRTGDFAQRKTLVKFDSAALADGLVSRFEKRIYDLLPELRATHGWVSDKPEGVAVTSRGHVFVVTDNDGVDDWSGETSLLRLGRLKRLFD